TGDAQDGAWVGSSKVRGRGALLVVLRPHACVRFHHNQGRKRREARRRCPPVPVSRRVERRVQGWENELERQDRLATPVPGPPGLDREDSPSYDCEWRIQLRFHRRRRQLWLGDSPTPTSSRA